MSVIWIVDEKGTPSVLQWPSLLREAGHQVELIAPSSERICAADWRRVDLLWVEWEKLAGEPDAALWALARRHPWVGVLCAVEGDSPEKRQELVRLGAWGCLVRPISAEEMGRAVEMALELSRFRRRESAAPLHNAVNDPTSLEQALSQHRWRIKETAKSLGISRITLWRRMKSAGISLSSSE
ncbi:MAG: hypothetical protein HQL51_16630 [Magnetococcales bacterium]|nr:hypothetical protein [Magnetococcales bacterium]